MAEYDVSRDLPAPMEIAYDVAARAERMAAWLPTTVDVEPAGPGRVHVEGRTGHGAYAADGSFRADTDRMRLEWGSLGGDDYTGWLQFADSGAGASTATLHLSFRGGQPQAQETGEAGDATRREMAEALDRLAAEVGRRAYDAS